MWFLKKLFKKRDEQLAEDGDIVKPFLDHLEDLRWTLVKMIGTLAATMLLAFAFRTKLASVLGHPLQTIVGDIRKVLIITGPIDSITVSFTLAFYAGIIISFPILFYFLAEFLLPALTRKEKKYVMPAVGVGFGLFLTGVLLCYFLVLPVTLRWLLSDASAFGEARWTIREYYGFITHLCIAIGLVCELPVVMVTLSAIGLISYAWLKGMRVYGYAIALVLAGIISPTPDLFMLLIFALPIMILFEACIWIVWFLEKRRAKHEEAEVRREHPVPTREETHPPSPEDPHHDYHEEHHPHGDGHDEHGNYIGDGHGHDDHGEYPRDGHSGEGETVGEKKDDPEEPGKPQA